MPSDRENYLEEQRTLFEWIPLTRYLEMFPEETAGGVAVRRRRGFWVEGVHIRKARGMDTWVNLRNIKALLEEPAPKDRSKEPLTVGASE